LKEATKYGNRDAEQQAHSYNTMMMYEIADMIDDAPTIDAVPVVRGEWIYNKYYTWECGNCGFHPFKGYIPKEPGFNFCPNCGADMRKGGAE